MSYEGDNRREEEKESWHVSKGVSVAHIISTVMLLAAIVGIWQGMKAATAEAHTLAITNTQSIKFVKELQQQKDASQDRNIERIFEVVEKINTKLDRLIESK